MDKDQGTYGRKISSEENGQPFVFSKGPENITDESFSLVKKTTLWVFEAGPVQMPPTVPRSASLSPLLLSDCLLPWQ